MSTTAGEPLEHILSATCKTHDRGVPDRCVVHVHPSMFVSGVDVECRVGTAFVKKNFAIPKSNT